MPNYNVTVPDTAQCAIYHDLDGRLLLTSLTFKYLAGTPGFVEAKDLADYVQYNWRSFILPHLGRNLDQSVTIVLSLDHSNFYVNGTTSPHAFGGEGSDALPNNCGFRVEFATSLPGRAHRGWNTIPAIPIGAVLHNQVKPTWADLIVAAYEAMITGSLAVNWQWVVTSTMLAGAERAVGITTPVTSVYYKDLIVDSSRHRLPGRRFS